MQQLIHYIEQFVKLDEDAISALKSLASKETYKKNQHILEAGQRCTKIWFLKKGLVRKYGLNDGNEVTYWIHTEYDTFTSLQSYAQQTYSKEYIQACEYTETISISKENSKKLAKYPAFTVFSNALMEQEFVNVDIHTKALRQKDAKGRYEYLQEIAPEMIKRAKLGQIASIIGVTQETLSRIRKA